MSAADEIIMIWYDTGRLQCTTRTHQEMR